MAKRPVTFQQCEWAAIELLCRIGHRMQKRLGPQVTEVTFRRLANIFELVAVDVEGAFEMNRLVGDGKGGYDDAKCRKHHKRVRDICVGQWDREEAVIEYREQTEAFPC